MRSTKASPPSKPTHRARSSSAAGGIRARRSAPAATADIFLEDGELRVGHDRNSLKPGRTLEKLYLDPLLERVRLNRGRVYPWPGEFTLLVDVKADGRKVFSELTKRLGKYREMLTSREPFSDLRIINAGVVKPGAVTIILSGDRAIEQIAEAQKRFVFVDGRLSGEFGAALTTLTPLVSDSYQGLFQWNGHGDMPAPERLRLKILVAKVHANHQRFRLWAVPDTEDAWREMDIAGVDLINTDRLAGLAAYLQKPRD